MYLIKVYKGHILIKLMCKDKSFTIHLHKYIPLVYSAVVNNCCELARGQQRAEKARHFEKFQLGEHLATN